MTGTAEGAEDRPVLHVLTPDATAEEVAALVAVLGGLGGDEPRQPPPRVWNAPSRLVRRTPQAGPGAWRASGLPR